MLFPDIDPVTLGLSVVTCPRQSRGVLSMECGFSTYLSMIKLQVSREEGLIGTSCRLLERHTP